LSARATARVSDVSVPSGAALGADTTARGGGELGVDGGAAGLSGGSGTGVAAATGDAELVAATEGEDVEALMTGDGGGDASARSIVGGMGRAGGGAAAARTEDKVGRGGDGTEVRVGGREVVFCRGVGAVTGGAATGTSTIAGLSTAATRSAAATVAGALSVTFVADAADAESRTTSSCGSNVRSADALVRTAWR